MISRRETIGGTHLLILYEQVNPLTNISHITRQLSYVPADAEVVYLGWRSPTESVRVDPVDGPGVFAGAGWCAHAYIVTHEAAKRIVNLLTPIPAIVDVVS